MNGLSWMASAKSGFTGKPFRARSIDGAKSLDQGKRPCRSWRAFHPCHISLVWTHRSRLTSHFSRDTYCETAHRRLGLIRTVLRVHLIVSYRLRANDRTYGLITSRRHGLPEINHFVSVTTIIVIEADQHEPSLLVSITDLIRGTYSSNTGMISIDSPHT